MASYILSEYETRLIRVSREIWDNLPEYLPQAQQHPIRKRLPSFSQGREGSGSSVQCPNFPEGTTLQRTVFCLANLGPQRALHSLRAWGRMETAPPPSSLKVSRPKPQLTASSWGVQEALCCLMPQLFWRLPKGQASDLPALACWWHLASSGCTEASKNRDGDLGLVVTTVLLPVQHRVSGWKNPAPGFSPERERIKWTVQQSNVWGNAQGIGFSLPCPDALTGLGLP